MFDYIIFIDNRTKPKHSNQVEMKLSSKHVLFFREDSYGLQELKLLFISLMGHLREDRGDGVRLKSFVNKIGLLLNMKLVKTSGCSS